MILSRVIEHVKAQNWTAIFLDFVIVVLGVFVGMQVNNWNAARVERARTDILVERLEREFSDLRAETASELKRAQDREMAVANLIFYLQSGKQIAPGRRILDDIDLTLSPNRAPARSAIYQQMISSGDLSLLRNDALAEALIKYDQFLDVGQNYYSGHLEALAAARRVFDATQMRVVDANGAIDRSLENYDEKTLAGAVSELEVIFQYQGSIRALLARTLAADDTILALIREERK